MILLRGDDRCVHEGHHAYLLTLHPDGRGLTLTEEKLQPVLRKLKLAEPGTGMNAFRRGRISHLVYSGVSRQVIRDWCGHSSDKMVDHYTRMLRQHQAPEMAKVKPLLDPPPVGCAQRVAGFPPVGLMVGTQTCDEALQFDRFNSARDGSCDPG